DQTEACWPTLSAELPSPASDSPQNSAANAGFSSAASPSQAGGPEPCRAMDRLDRWRCQAGRSRPSGPATQEEVMDRIRDSIAAQFALRIQAGRDKDHPETNPEAPGGELAFVAVGSTAKSGVEVPGSAAEDAGAAFGAFRILLRAALVVVWV